MNVWVLMPVKRKENAIDAAHRWKAKGYRIAFFQDASAGPTFTSEPTITGEYRGYWNAANRLSAAAFAEGADVCVFAGDDMDPDPLRAPVIGREYLDRFPDGFGIMQPCGDMQGKDAKGIQAAKRICGSAWFGRGWAERAYLGKGPTDERYWHFYADESLKCVAEKLGVLWWRPDLIQFHKHWSWGWVPIQDYHRANQVHWDADYAIFKASQEAGFPEGEPLPL